MINRALFVAMLCAVGVSACNNNSTSGTVSAPTTTRTTDTFSGTVQVGSSVFHSFPVAQPGTTDVTLTTTSPSSTVMGLAVGTTGDGGCTPLAGASSNVVAGSTPQITGLTTTGTLCVQIRDIGQATGPVSYTITVTHP